MKGGDKWEKSLFVISSFAPRQPPNCVNFRAVKTSSNPPPPSVYPGNKVFAPDEPAHNEATNVVLVIIRMEL